MEFQWSSFKSWKMMLWKCYTQYASKFGTQQWPQDWKRWVFIKSQREAMPKNAQTTTQFLSSHFSSVQSLSPVRLFANPWIAAHQASLSITNSWRSLRLTSIESVMPSSHLNLSTPSPPAPNPSHHQSLFHSIRSLYCSGWNKKSFRKENSSGMIWILIGKRKCIRFSMLYSLYTFLQMIIFPTQMIFHSYWK